MNFQISISFSELSIEKFKHIKCACLITSETENDRHVHGHPNQLDLKELI